MTNTQQPEALRLAEELDKLPFMRDAVAELRRLQSRMKELEAENRTLAANHTGMMIDYSGLFKQAIDALQHGSQEKALAWMLKHLQTHMEQLGQRWYAGDTAVVDEFLQLYCIASEAREAIAQEGGKHG